jgi:SAM-dependent methyltransferase
VAHGPEVQAYDLRRGLPFEAESYDAVYHSHVLEHLTPSHAAIMMHECYRVLRPGGIVRVVVPDLEGIARTYLQALDHATRSDDQMAVANHQWMTLELLDQLTRQQCGGQMWQTMQKPDQLNRDFIRQRMGSEMDSSPTIGTRKTISMRLSRSLRGVRRQLALTAVTLIEGTTGREVYREGSFRQSGEIHRWMYDRLSLTRLLQQVGFEIPTVCSAEQSFIPEFDGYQLDRVNGAVRKPDSLYLEGVKPPVPPRIAQSAVDSLSAQLVGTDQGVQ